MSRYRCPGNSSRGAPCEAQEEAACCRYLGVADLLLSLLLFVFPLFCTLLRVVDHVTCPIEREGGGGLRGITSHAAAFIPFKDYNWELKF